eukprot:94484-Pelagomonas_calceolata.AAC.1
MSKFRHIGGLAPVVLISKVCAQYNKSHQPRIVCMLTLCNLQLLPTGRPVSSHIQFLSSARAAGLHSVDGVV